MNERERFYKAFPKHAGILEMDEAGSISPIESITARHQFAVWQACVESKQAELDKANARIAQLEEALNVADSYIPIHGRYEFHNANVDLINKAITESSDTWLSEHDKAVYVTMFKDINFFDVQAASDETGIDYNKLSIAIRYIYDRMIESRK